jgi:hypothetical protein
MHAVGPAPHCHIGAALTSLMTQVRSSRSAKAESLALQKSVTRAWHIHSRSSSGFRLHSHPAGMKYCFLRQVQNSIHCFRGSTPAWVLAAAWCKTPCALCVVGCQVHWPAAPLASLLQLQRLHVPNPQSPELHNVKPACHLSRPKVEDTLPTHIVLPRFVFHFTQISSKQRSVPELC